MTTKPANITLDDVLETSRAIVNHKASRGAIGVSVDQVVAMAHSVCGLDDVARLAAEYFATRERMFAAGAAGDVEGEQAADDQLDDIDAELTGALGALGYLTLVEQEAPDGPRN
ncbi:MAG: hypothetical protein DI607_11810 [Sphingomonas hengshuiensis]|nr:MAG: hypothetical protein DI607_11810 [Sphingomonas hengshuiensis]